MFMLQLVPPTPNASVSEADSTCATGPFRIMTAMTTRTISSANKPSNRSTKLRWSKNSRRLQRASVRGRNIWS